MDNKFYVLKLEIFSYNLMSMYFFYKIIITDIRITYPVAKIFRCHYR